MALKIITKFNCKIYQNFGKQCFSGVWNVNHHFSDDATKNAKAMESKLKIPKEMFQKASHDQAMSQTVQLQPAKLQKYFDPQENEDFEQDPSFMTNRPRHFEASTTCKSVKLPLKQPKLASPFPDPVKVMPSDTVSDQEKANQMQAEARIPTGLNTIEHPSIKSPQFRSYSSMPPQSCTNDCVEKTESDDKVENPKFVPSDSCEYQIVKNVHLRKSTPYPSYSEVCNSELSLRDKQAYLNELSWTPQYYPFYRIKKYSYYPKRGIHLGYSHWKRHNQLGACSKENQKPCPRPRRQCPPGSEKFTKISNKDLRKGKFKKEKPANKKKTTAILNIESFLLVFRGTCEKKKSPLFFRNVPIITPHQRAKEISVKKTKKEWTYKGKCKKLPFRHYNYEHKTKKSTKKKFHKKKKQVEDCPEERYKRTMPKIDLSYFLSAIKSKQLPKIDQISLSDGTDKLNKSLSDGTDKLNKSVEKGLITIKNFPIELMNKKKNKAKLYKKK